MLGMRRSYEPTGLNFQIRVVWRPTYHLVLVAFWRWSWTWDRIV